MLQKRWTLKNVGDELAIKDLADSLNISEILAALLVQRNIKNYSEAKKFFRPSLESLQNHLICIYGDYDGDGTCATAVLYLFLKELDANVEFYIPNRLEEGYGLSNEAMDHVKEKGTSLLITVDCGINSKPEIAFAQKLGMEVIVTDHHQPPEDFDANQKYSIVHQMYPGHEYSNQKIFLNSCNVIS